jgi:serine/threonine-protein kinase HipA
MVTALKTLSVDEVVQNWMFAKFRKARLAMEALIDRSFLDKDRQTAYKDLIMKKSQQIRLDL